MGQSYLAGTPRERAMQVRGWSDKKAVRKQIIDLLDRGEVRVTQRDHRVVDEFAARLHINAEYLEPVLRALVLSGNAKVVVEGGREVGLVLNADRRTGSSAAASSEPKLNQIEARLLEALRQFVFAAPVALTKLAQFCKLADTDSRLKDGIKHLEGVGLIKIEREGRDVVSIALNDDVTRPTWVPLRKAQPPTSQSQQPHRFVPTAQASARHRAQRGATQFKPTPSPPPKAQPSSLEAAAAARQQADKTNERLRRLVNALGKRHKGRLDHLNMATMNQLLGNGVMFFSPTEMYSFLDLPAVKERVCVVSRNEGNALVLVNYTAPTPPPASPPAGHPSTRPAASTPPSREPSRTPASISLSVLRYLIDQGGAVEGDGAATKVILGRIGRSGYDLNKFNTEVRRLVDLRFIRQSHFGRRRASMEITDQGRKLAEASQRPA